MMRPVRTSLRGPLQALVALWAVTGLVACASAPGPSAESESSGPYPASRSDAVADTHAHPVVAVAHGLIGVPYRYGGATPKGFDCSGLVYYSHRKVGVAVPRTTRQQRRVSEPVDPSRLRPGDVVFFKLSGDKVSHVGIYVGRGRFIHAPSKGKGVSYASLRDPYWRQRLLDAGRL